MEVIHLVLVPVKTLKLADGHISLGFECLQDQEDICPPHNIIIITKSDSDLTE